MKNSRTKCEPKIISHFCSPMTAEKLVGIDWRSLFGIDELAVEVKLTPPSDPNTDCDGVEAVG